MKVIKYKKIEGCMEGTNIIDFRFDTAVGKEFIQELSEKMGGRLKVATGSLPLPYFTIIVKGECTLKGNIGGMTLRAMLAEGLGIEWREAFTAMIEGMNPEGMNPDGMNPDGIVPRHDIQ